MVQLLTKSILVSARFQGMRLRCHTWQVEPLQVEEVRSSFFEDEALFPKGSIQFDCALLMRGIEHEWHGQADLCCAMGGPAHENIHSAGAA